MMSRWISHHLLIIKLVLGRMRANLLSSLMICLVVAVAMCIPGLFYLGVENLANLSRHMQDETEISLFLRHGTSAKKIAEIDALLAKNEAIKQYHLVPKEDAWQKVQSSSDTSDEINNAILQLSENPLPDAFFIQAKSTDPETLNALKTELQNISGVEQALLNSEWAKRLSALLALGKKVIFLIASLLAVALLVIIGNTVHMQMLTQKDEIEVSNLMGATNSFIRTPFLYAGVFYGLFGSLLAILMIAASIVFFNQSVAQISNLYNSDFRLSLFNANLFFTIIISAIFIGWLGSYLAVTRAINALKFS